jgi:hypothetical protein
MGICESSQPPGKRKYFDILNNCFCPDSPSSSSSSSGDTSVTALSLKKGQSSLDACTSDALTLGYYQLGENIRQVGASLYSTPNLSSPLSNGYYAWRDVLILPGPGSRDRWFRILNGKISETDRCNLY